VSSQKKYLQLYSSITASIGDGSYSSGDKLPTELELAEKYAVSRQTVRQALEKLERDGLISKVQGSGSYVSSKAQSMKKTMRIAVITTYISTYIFPYILRGIEEVLASEGYTIQLMATNNSISKERSVLHNLCVNNVDGIIVEGTKTALPNPNLSFYRDLANKNTPLVFFNGYYPELLDQANHGIVSVVTDDYSGAYEMTMDLIQKGHTAIGGIFKSDDMQGIKRFSGFIDALSQTDFEIDDDRVLWFNTENKSVTSFMLKNRISISKCTAIVCYNDEIAMQLITFLNSNPNSITAIRSFDGTFVPHQSYLDYRSLGHPKERLGRVTAERIFSILDGKKEESVVMPWDEASEGNA